MKTSVVIALYNGEKYIIPQLKSIVEQTRQPDEVLLFDDCSIDQTYSVVEKFIKNHNLTNWIIQKNEKNLGWRRNFTELLKTSSGDVVFFCDQDDIWDKNKIEYMCSVLKEHPEIEVLACNYDWIFETPEDNWKGFRPSYKPYGNKELERVSTIWWHAAIRLGSTLAVRSSIKDYVVNLMSGDMSHDGLTEAIGLSRNSFYIFNKTLMNHRIHGNNNTPVYKHTKTEWLKMINSMYFMWKTIRKSELNICNKNLKEIDRDLQFLELRIKTIEQRSIRGYLKLLLCIKLYPRFRTWMGDIACSFR